MNRQKPIYLDYNATTPIEPRVAKAMEPYLYGMFGNPSSAHPYGAEARKAMQQARRDMASLIGCPVGDVVFTGGGSEANNMAIIGVAEACENQGGHLVISAVEHPAVIEPCRYLERRGFQLTIVPVDSTGQVDPAEVAKAMRPDTILVSIMTANNEVGTVQPIAEIVDIAHRSGALMHTDAAQAVGKIPVNVEDLGVDLLSVAGHKFYAPKGVGALYVRSGVMLAKYLHGADHEMDRRAGTENVLEIVGLGEAARIAREEGAAVMRHMSTMRARLLHALEKELGETVDWQVNGHPEHHLPNTLSISFRNIEANTLLSDIQEKVAASAGAACHAESVELSPVLEAMQIPEIFAMGTIRLSVGRMTTEADVEEAATVIADSVRRFHPDTAATTTLSSGDEVRLTHYTHGLGCACKLRPQALEEVLKKLPLPENPDILVDISTSDDAAVYKLRDDLAVVVTVDFFTPIADDPYQFGEISAANSLSDIYAMGAEPLFALNIVGFPTNRLPLSVLEDILAGAQAKAAEAGVSILGGHTVDDTEPKYGMAVVGVAHPDEVLRNSTAWAGDALVLTKPIGTGILTTGIKQDLTEPEDAARAMQSMAMLNKTAATLMRSYPVHACTDVTGFGLLGHLLEMTRSAGLDARLDCSAVPVLPGAIDLAAAGVIPGGTRDNLAFVRDSLVIDKGVSELDQLILADAQTSGGLLIAVEADAAGSLVTELMEGGLPYTAIIGYFTERGDGAIHIEKSAAARQRNA